MPGDLQMCFNPLARLGLAVLLLVCGATFAMSVDQNYAYQLREKIMEDTILMQLSFKKEIRIVILEHHLSF